MNETFSIMLDFPESIFRGVDPLTKRAEPVPHPDRIYRAFVASAYGLGFTPEIGSALEELAKLGPPARIKAPPVSVNLPLMEFLLPSYGVEGITPRSPNLRHSVSYPEDNSQVYYQWDTGLSPEAREVLQLLVEGISYIGRSESTCEVHLVDEIPGEATHVLSEEQSNGQSLRMRVFGEGHLGRLQKEHEGKMKNPDFRWQRGANSCRWYVSEDSTGATKDAFDPDRFFCLTLDKGGVDLRNWLIFSERIRTELLRKLPKEQLLQGKDPERKRHRVAIVPLAHVGHRQANGKVLGVGLIFPESATWTEMEAIKAASCDLPVRVRFGATWRNHLLQEVPCGYEGKTLTQEFWCRPSKTWHSITPMFTDKMLRPRAKESRDFVQREFLGGKSFKDLFGDISELELAQKTNRYLAQHRSWQSVHYSLLECSLEGQGFPTPLSIKAGHDSAFLHVSQSSNFHVPNKRKRGRAYSHATIRFSEPVHGPMLLGSCRYFGMGFFFPQGDT